MATSDGGTSAERWLDVCNLQKMDLADCIAKEHEGRGCVPEDHANEMRNKLREHSSSESEGEDGMMTLRFYDGSGVRMTSEGEEMNMVLLGVGEVEEQTSFLPSVPEEEASPDAPFRVSLADPSKTDATLRVYRSRWNHYEDWCVSIGVETLPASRETLADYIRSLAAAGKGVPTARQALASVRLASRNAGLGEPSTDGLAEIAADASLLNSVPASEIQQPLGAEALAAIRLSAKTPRLGKGGREETVEEADERGALDIALAHLLSDAGLKISEAAALSWADLRIEGKKKDSFVRAPASPDVRTPRMDEPTETLLALTPETAKALTALKKRSEEKEGFSESGGVFGMDAKAAARRLEATARAANLDGKFGTQSGRLGLAQRMHEKGAPIEAILKQGRWTDENAAPRFPRPSASGFDPRPWM